MVRMRVIAIAIERERESRVRVRARARQKDRKIGRQKDRKIEWASYTHIITLNAPAFVLFLISSTHWEIRDMGVTTRV